MRFALQEPVCVCLLLSKTDYLCRLKHVLLANSDLFFWRSLISPFRTERVRESLQAGC